MTADLHTHCWKGGEFELVSTVQYGEFPYQSLECHPWYLPESFSSLSSDFISGAARFSAIGEIGLDRLRGPEPAVQRKYFDALLELAESLDKPVVIHCVRCDAELFHALDGFRGRVLVHGFNGGVRKLEKYLESGYLVSFSKLHNHDVISYLRRSGLHNTGIETDDLKCSIDRIASEIASALELPESVVNENSVQTFKRLLAI